MAGPPGSAFPPPKQGPPAWLLWTAGAVLAIGGVFLGLGAAGVFRAKSNDAPPPALRATGTPPDSSLKVEGQPPESPLRSTTERRQMPQHLIDWLEHLRKTEESRVAIATDQLSEALVLFTTAKMGDAFNISEFLDPESNMSTSPTQQRVTGGTEQMGAKWAELEEYFHSYPPPTECVAIRDEYSTVLSETKVMLMDIVGVLENAQNNPQEAIKTLTAMQGKSNTRIDQPAVRTDVRVGDLCREFDTTPWFRITGDVGQSLFSKFGF